MKTWCVWLSVLMMVTSAFSQEMFFETKNLGGTAYTTATVVAINQQNHLFVGTRSDGAVYRSIDGGSSWVPKKPQSEVDWIYDVTMLGNVCLLAGTGGSTTAAKGLYSSTDNGDTWVKTSQGLASGYVSCILVAPNGYVYVGVGSAVYRSIDSCKNFEKKSTGLSTTVSWLTSAPNGDIYVGQFNYIYKSTDNGGTWTKVIGGIATDNVNHIYINKQGHIFVSFATKYIYRSTDNGSNWLQVKTGLEALTGTVACVTENSSGILFAGTSDAGYAGALFKSADNGNSWTKAGNGPCFNLLSDLICCSQGYLYARCGGAVLKSKASTTTQVERISVTFPQHHQLFTNYPNPFNPQTTIMFDIPEEQFVTLSIYDALGREVEQLVKEVLPRGRYYSRWNASRFSSGTYFYALTVSALESRERKFSEVRKLMLTK